MKGYFYHGIEFYPGAVGKVIQLLIKILDEGLIFRSQASGFEDEKMNHICLYKKNEDYDYNSDLALIHSARGGWIDGQFVFIIDQNVDARKAILGSETNLVDEWRCFQNISPTKFVGIALPVDSIEDYLNEKSYDEIEEQDKVAVKQYLPVLIEKAQSMKLAIEDSGQPNFTDYYDNLASNRGL